jgi:hypothetical protein
MTKTATRSKIMPFDIIADSSRFEFLNLVHCDLFEICYLVLGIYTNSPCPLQKPINSQ